MSSSLCKVSSRREISGMSTARLKIGLGRPTTSSRRLRMSFQPFVGEIMIFGGNFAPKGWALCNGQLMPISQNTALFSILGTQYGGNGQTTFALPNLQGSAPL